MIAYKVVGKNKCSTNWEIFSNGNNSHYATPALLKRLIKLQWVKLYYKGRTITAHKDSVGILCFKRRKDARFFKNRYWGLCYTKIIRVEGIGRSTTKIRLERAMGSYMRNTHNFGEDYADSMPAPRGTIAFRSVKVLE